MRIIEYEGPVRKVTRKIWSAKIRGRNRQKGQAGEDEKEDSFASHVSLARARVSRLSLCPAISSWRANALVCLCNRPFVSSLYCIPVLLVDVFERIAQAWRWTAAPRSQRRRVAKSEMAEEQRAAGIQHGRQHRFWPLVYSAYHTGRKQHDECCRRMGPWHARGSLACTYLLQQTSLFLLPAPSPTASPVFLV